VNIVLTVAKSDKDVRGKIQYALGMRGMKAEDPTRLIEWERWNVDTGDPKGAMDVWLDHAYSSMHERMMCGRRGRPIKNMAYHITMNEDFQMEIFEFVREGLWNWINRDFIDYMGIIAYHFRDDRFHSHIVINPIPMDFNGNLLRIGKRDQWWRNNYAKEVTNSVVNGFAKLSKQFGLTSRADEIGIPNVFEMDGANKNYYSYLRQNREKVLNEIRRKRGVEPLQL
jgi:hypothetical protein